MCPGLSVMTEDYTCSGIRRFSDAEGKKKRKYILQIFDFSANKSLSGILNSCLDSHHLLLQILSKK